MTPFKDWGVVNFLQENAPKVAKSVLGVAGGVLTGESPVKAIFDEIKGAGDLTESQKEIALKKLEQDLEEKKLAFKDRKSARTREISLSKADSIGIYVQNLSAVLLILAFVSCVFLLFYGDLSSTNQNLIHLLIGGLVGLVNTVFNYWFGTSSVNDKQQFQELTKNR